MGYWKTISTLDLEYVFPTHIISNKRGWKYLANKNVTLYETIKTLENLVSIIFPLKRNKKIPYFPKMLVFPGNNTVYGKTKTRKITYLS